MIWDRQTPEKNEPSDRKQTVEESELFAERERDVSKNVLLWMDMRVHR